MGKKVIDIFPDELEELLSKSREDYLVVDVRQPAEYAQGHIPKAQLIPLPEIESRVHEIALQTNLVLYCRTGGRSAVAGALIEDTISRTGTTYNLVGGITGWQGKKLKDVPRIEPFPRDMPLSQALYRAMNLEKGAWIFYNELARSNFGTELGEMLVEIGSIEEDHARQIFPYWKTHTTALVTEGFETLFARLDGRIIEGGLPIPAWIARMGADPQDRKLCLLELACEIEYYAYDLYRSLAKREEIPDAAQTYLAIAEQEKTHIHIISQALDKLFRV